MEPENIQSLPFLTRKMLSFEHGARFELSIETLSTTAVVLTIRGFTREGFFAFKHTSLASGEYAGTNFQIPDIPIWIDVISETTSHYEGDCYATLLLKINGDIIHQFAAGYVHNAKGLCWPASQTQPFTPTSGLLTRLTSADPAAGSEISLTVAANRRIHVLSASFTLAAAAVAASRRVHLVFTTSGADSIHCFSSIDQIISENKLYTCAAYGAVPDETDSTTILIPIPPNIWLKEDDVIKTITTNLDAGDNFGIMSVYCEQFVQLAP